MQLTISELQPACDLLLTGQIIAFPTETVYGLMADATNEQAIEQLFLIKGRGDNPISILVADLGMFEHYGQIRYPTERLLMETYMPGPLTLVVPKKNIPDTLTAGKTNVGIRIPQLASTRELVRRVGKAVAATSANPSGQPAATDAEQVRQYFQGTVNNEQGTDNTTPKIQHPKFNTQRLTLIVDGGHCSVGVASTVVEMLDEKTLKIHRPGAIEKKILEELFDKNNVQITIS